MWDLNNEGENLSEWWAYGSHEEYMKQYTKFYVDTIIPVMRDSGIKVEENFMDTSPSNGILSYEPYVKRTDKRLNTQSPNFGDGHFYYMMWDCESDTTHPYFRFLSESGFQSESSFIDYYTVSQPEDWNMNSKFLKLRTTFGNGHGGMVVQSARHYEVPVVHTEDPKQQADTFAYYIWLSQI